MSIWNYIGGFLLLRWLFGDRSGNHNVGGGYNADTTDYLHRHYNEDDGFSSNDYNHFSKSSYRGADIYDDEDDALDDYDLTDGDDCLSDDLF